MTPSKTHYFNIPATPDTITKLRISRNEDNVLAARPHISDFNATTIQQSLQEDRGRRKHELQK